MGKTLLQKIYLQSGLGIPVQRAAAADPQNVWQTLFTITGGPVILTYLIGVRTVAHLGGASTMQFRHSLGSVLDVGTLSINDPDAVNYMYYLTGDPADPIVKSLAGGGVVVTGKIVASSLTHQGIGLVLQVGTIQVTMTAAAGTGSTAYYMGYIPVSPLASVA